MGRPTPAVLALLGASIIVAIFRFVVPGADSAMEE
jgi:hypothetical protein